MTYTLISIMQINVNKMKTQTLSINQKHNYYLFNLEIWYLFTAEDVPEQQEKKGEYFFFSFGIDLNSFVCSDRSSCNFILGCVANFKTKDLKFSMQWSLAFDLCPMLEVYKGYCYSGYLRWWITGL